MTMSKTQTNQCIIKRSVNCSPKSALKKNSTLFYSWGYITMYLPERPKYPMVAKVHHCIPWKPFGGQLFKTSNNIQDTKLIFNNYIIPEWYISVAIFVSKSIYRTKLFVIVNDLTGISISITNFLQIFMRAANQKQNSTESIKVAVVIPNTFVQ